MDQKPLDYLRCVVERITYQSDGYSVLKCAAKGYNDLIAVVGMMQDTHDGSGLAVGGHWKIDSKYGRQFEVVTFEETLPATVYGIEKYLGSGLIKGIGPKFAKLIVKQFGKDTLDVIETSPDELINVPGIGAKRGESIKKGWNDQKEIKNIMLFLQGHDVSTAHATKIYKQYGAKSIEIVTENPYRLADDIWGIGFKTADTIAAKLGFEKDKSIIVQLQNRFHVSAAEIDEQDTHQIIVVGIAAIVPHNAMADSLMDEISVFVEENTEAEILDEQREIR